MQFLSVGEHLARGGGEAADDDEAGSQDAGHRQQVRFLVPTSLTPRFPARDRHHAKGVSCSAD